MESRNDNRICDVGGRIGYFHTWEHYSQPVEASPLVGGAPPGIISRVYGIVEFTDGVKRVDPTEIMFCDKESSILIQLNQCMERMKAND